MSARFRLTEVRLVSMEETTGETIVEDAVIAIDRGWIRWAGPASALPPDLLDWEPRSVEGRLVTPGLIDCHTHLVHGGSRAHEFAARLKGATYASIAQAGGGIRSTVFATRAASEETLLRDALRRLDARLDEGVTTVEVKSGYGLDWASEAKMLRTARRLAEHRSVRVVTSFLGAHALPPNHSGSPEDYLLSLRERVLPALKQAGLVDAVDAYCESIAFSAVQLRPLFDTARELGLPIRIHADQISDAGGARLAAEYGALSADHLEFTTEDDVRELARAGTVAVLLPGAYYTLRQTQLPPIDALRRHGVPMAVATDDNPGTSPLSSLLIALNMACTLFGLTTEEALAGATRHAARALGLHAELGTIAAGKRADLAVWDVDAPIELIYRMGSSPLAWSLVGGERRPRTGRDRP